MPRRLIQRLVVKGLTKYTAALRRSGFDKSAT